MTMSLRVSRKLFLSQPSCFRPVTGAHSLRIAFYPDLSHGYKIFVKGCFCQSGGQEGKHILNTMELHWGAPNWEVPHVLPSRLCMATVKHRSNSQILNSSFSAKDLGSLSGRLFSTFSFSSSSYSFSYFTVYFGYIHKITVENSCHHLTSNYNIIKEPVAAWVQFVSLCHYYVTVKFSNEQLISHKQNKKRRDLNNKNTADR